MWNPFNPTTKRAIGEHFETQACKYLQQQGLVFKDKNINFRFGEIDLIMLDNEQLVFVEVRYRRSSEFGGSAASVDRHKQAKLTKAAQLYLQKYYGNQPPSCRFDVVAITKLKQDIQVNWIKNAFY